MIDPDEFPPIDTTRIHSESAEGVLELEVLTCDSDDTADSFDVSLQGNVPDTYGISGSGSMNGVMEDGKLVVRWSDSQGISTEAQDDMVRATFVAARLLGAESIGGTIGSTMVEATKRVLGRSAVEDRIVTDPRLPSFVRHAIEYTLPR